MIGTSRRLGLRRCFERGENARSMCEILMCDGNSFGDSMNYWFDAFTGITWNEFRAAGAKVTGFRDHNWKRAEKIRPGDIFLCYMVGAKRWVGLLEVTGERYRDETPIWREEIFRVRRLPLLPNRCMKCAASYPIVPCATD
jgi:hypothetical protein